MFSKEEAAQLRENFWIAFGKSFPRKWLLYNTKIKGFSFKFLANKKQAAVCLDLEHPNEIANELLFDQLLSLKSILEEDIPEVLFDATYPLESGKIIHRIYIPFDQKFSIHNKNTWKACFEFFVEKMNLFEIFFYEYEDHIKQAIQ